MSDGTGSTPTGGEFMAGRPAPGPVPVAAAPASGPLSAEDLVALNEEIVALARAGLPLDKGLSALAKEMGRGKLKKLTQQIADDLRGGMTLPQAIERQKGAVPSYYAAVLAAGMRSGRLGDVLSTLTMYARSINEFRSNVISALLYPAIVLLLGYGLLVYTSVVVLPPFEEIFAGFRMRLPTMTMMMIFVGKHPIETLVVPPISLLVTLIGVRLVMRRTQAGRMAWARFVNALPIVGTLVRSARLAAFTDLLGILVEQKIPLPEALGLATEASSDVLLLESGKQVQKDLEQGVSLGEAIYRQRLVPELIVWMTSFGERHGTLPAALRELAQMYRRQAEARASLMRSVLPPFLILVIAGTIAGFFIFGVLGPMYELLGGLTNL